MGEGRWGRGGEAPLLTLFQHPQAHEHSQPVSTTFACSLLRYLLSGRSVFSFLSYPLHPTPKTWRIRAEMGNRGDERKRGCVRAGRQRRFLSERKKKVWRLGVSLEVLRNGYSVRFRVSKLKKQGGGCSRGSSAECLQSVKKVGKGPWLF